MAKTDNISTDTTIPKHDSSYRPDIDGLRSVAVISVILFHINPLLLPGGFVGVDIFFVISGYLISLHIFKDIESSKFTIVEFYRRRVKRIMPAMFVVVAFSIILAQFLYRPEDALDTASSGLWSLFSMANVYFWLYQDTSYFATASNIKPLLHLWSLGVEEQFYIVWPLVLLVLYKRIATPFFLALIVVTACISFILAELLFERSPSFVYYMLPTRAGELLLGAMAALLVLKYDLSHLPKTVLSYLGMVLIIGSLVFLHEDIVFPGFLAIPATLGTAFIILAGHIGPTLPGRFLTLKPMLWVGMISYSAYLWHWPLLAFYRYGQAEMTLLAGTVIFFLTLGLAWLSYRFVEQPARYTKKSAAQVFLRQFAYPTAVLSAIAILAIQLQGYGSRWFSPEYKSDLAQLKEDTRPAVNFDYVCHKQFLTEPDMTDPICDLGLPENGKANAILWGDSNAAHFVGLTGAFSNQSEFRFKNLQVGSCPPIYGDPLPFVPANRYRDCKSSLELIWPTILEHDVVILGGSWTSYYQRSNQFFDVFFNTINELVAQDKLVIVYGKVPVNPNYDRLCLEKALSFPYMNCNVEASPLRQDIIEVNERIRQFSAATDNVEFYDINEFLCSNGSCLVYDEAGKPYYFDASHFSLSGSWNLGREVIEESGVPTPFQKITNWTAE